MNTTELQARHLPACHRTCFPASIESWARVNRVGLVPQAYTESIMGCIHQNERHAAANSRQHKSTTQGYSVRAHHDHIQAPIAAPLLALAISGPDPSLNHLGSGPEQAEPAIWRGLPPPATVAEVLDLRVGTFACHHS